MHGKWTVENFIKHDIANPNVYKLFERFALEASKYKQKYSAKSIFHRIRWETMVSEKDSQYKIDDGWISHYARKFMDNYPELEDFFEVRMRKDSYHNG
jgi:hypothetical protein|tara:strand:- start:266 stop:559 length:294 start_codon:yes stop_codon:yes gene_type:complete